MPKQSFLNKTSSLSFFKDKGFSLIEVLTVLVIVGVLSVVGIRSYQAQTNKAKTSEAKHSLSYVWTAEQGFKANWDTYHENLMAIGAVPAGSYSYDVGFGLNVDLSTTDGNLDVYPFKPILNAPKCTNFQQICNNDCLSALEEAGGSGETGKGKFFDTDNTTYNVKVSCNVTSTKLLKNSTDYTTNSPAANAKAEETTFKAYAMGLLKKIDIWSIDETRTLNHLDDGTQ